MNFFVDLISTATQWLPLERIGVEWTAWDSWIVLIGILCAMPCALLGNFLVLRRLSMMGDAISHAVLPGLAGGFLLILAMQHNESLAAISPSLAAWFDRTDPRNPLVLFIGAALIGILATVLIQWVQQLGRVDRGAAMGVVFTALFALGLLMIEQATRSHHVDLDAECVLFGMIELAPLDMVTLFGVTWPRPVFVLLPVLMLNGALVTLFYKELKISSFDEATAATQGVPVRAMHYGLMCLVAMTTVACFESIGSILVIAMLVVPPATAYLLTDRLGIMIWLSLLFGIASAWLGHIAAITLPRAVGFEDTNTAGMMASVAGVLFLLAMLFSPRHGVLFARWRSTHKLENATIAP